MTSPATHENSNDMLVPPYASCERQSSLVPATFNLVATIVGGGVLSLPLAFEKCGIGLASLLMMLAAVATDRSLYLLCKCARQTGATSYGEVGRMAFGKIMERAISLLLFVFLLFVMVAYLVLCRDIWTPLVGLALNKKRSTTITDKEVRGDWVLLGIVVFLAPFLVQRTLHSLRFNCYIGFCSVSILCIALCRQGLFPGHHHSSISHHIQDDESYTGALPVNNNNNNNNNSTNLLVSSPIAYLPDCAGDVLFALPIILLSFLCHFNVLSIQGALIRPSRLRMQSVIGSAITASWALMYLFGLGGYLYAREQTKGNILLNVIQHNNNHHNYNYSSSSNDTANGDGYNRLDEVLFLLGRIGCGITILLATPLMALPCRDSFLEIVDVTLVRQQEEEDHHIVEEGTRQQRRHDDEEELLLLRYSSGSDHQHDDKKNDTIPIPPPPLPTEETTLLLIRHEPIQHDLVFTNPYWHYGSTAGIILGCYIGAVAAPGVAIVWSLCGSTMAFLIAFILPTACYLRIQQKDTSTTTRTTDHPAVSLSSERLWVLFSWILLVASSLTAVACTCQTVQRLWDKGQHEH